MYNILKDKVIVGDEVFVPLITEEDIQKKVSELAAQISLDYKDKTPIFIGILNGAFVFMADLLKNIKIDCEIDFLKLSSYGDEKISSGKVQLLKDLNCQVENRDVIIVEDIVDSGLSIKFMNDLIKAHNPNSLKVVSLLVKPNGIKYDIKIDYIGFNIENNFVIGYGLDYAQKFRNLRSIFVLNENGK
jgi:hypoxanthine phosphoribosyltransferase